MYQLPYEAESGSDTDEDDFPGRLRAVGTASTLSMSSSEGGAQCSVVSSTPQGPVVRLPPVKPYIYVAASGESEGDDSQDAWGNTGKFLFYLFIDFILRVPLFSFLSSWCTYVS